MPRMLFGLDAFERTRGDLPEFPVVNMFAEQAPTEEIGVVLQSRPGLSDSGVVLGTGPVRSLFKGDGVLDSAFYGVSGSELYRGNVSLGAVDGSGPFSIAGYEDKLFVAGGASLWSYDGTSLALVSFPDDANVSKVLVGGSRAIALRADTEKFYWSDVLSGTIDALSFATAENQPDRLKDAIFIDDVLVLFGSETTEFWPNTGDPDLPFQPLEGRVFERGIKATGCATKFGSTFAWVTNTNQVCISDPENIVSRPGLEALIEASSSVRLQTFILEGIEFLWLKIDAGDWVFSARSRLWSQMASWGLVGWIPSCFAGGAFGSSVDGKTYSWGSGYLDAGNVLERRFRAGFPLNSGSVYVNDILLRANVGTTGYLTGTYADPVVEMRRSLDGGKTWGRWRQVSFGKQGEYRQKVHWTACGRASRPGWLSEFRVTDPVPFRVSDVILNEV